MVKPIGSTYQLASGPDEGRRLILPTLFAPRPLPFPSWTRELGWCPSSVMIAPMGQISPVSDIWLTRTINERLRQPESQPPPQRE